MSNPSSVSLVSTLLSTSFFYCNVIKPVFRVGRSRSVRRGGLVIARRRRNGHLSICLASTLSVSHDCTRRLVRHRKIAIGKGSTGTGHHLGRNSRMGTIVRIRRRCGIIPRSVPLSVICRSGSVVIVGGTHNVIIRPTTNGPSKALIGTLLCRYRKRLSNVGNIVHPNVIRHLSGSASNIVITTGASRTRGKLTRRVGTRSTRHAC